MNRLMLAGALLLFTGSVLIACRPPLDNDPQAAEMRRQQRAVAQLEEIRGRKYLADLEVVRVCARGETGYGQFVQRGPNGRLWISYYAEPTSWDQVTAVARGIEARDVC